MAETGKSMNAVELAAFLDGCWRNISIVLIDPDSGVESRLTLDDTSKVVYLRYFSGSVIPDRSSSHIMLATQ